MAVRRTPALAACEPSQQVLALDRLRSPAPDLAAYEASVAPRHAATRGPNHPFAPPAGAEIVLTMFAPGDPHQQEFTDTSTIVWKDAQGWHFDAVDYRPTYFPSPRPPGETPYTPEEYEELRRTAERGRLSAEQSAALEAALADPCLDLQPRSVPIEVPWIDGRTVPGCMGGFVGGTVAVTRGGRTELFSDLCGRWAAGRIMRIVLYPRADAPPPEPVPEPTAEELERRAREDRSLRHSYKVPPATLLRSQDWEEPCFRHESARRRILEAFAAEGLAVEAVNERPLEIYSVRQVADGRATYYWFRGSDALCAEGGACSIVHAGRFEGPVNPDGALVWAEAVAHSDAFTERLRALSGEIAAACTGPAEAAE